MIQDKEKWHYLGVTTLSALLRRIRPTNNGEIYCLDCLQLVRTKKRLLLCLQKKLRAFHLAFQFLQYYHLRA